MAGTETSGSINPDTSVAATPKPKKHANNQNSQQKSRKASRTPDVTTVTPLKQQQQQQQYYAGPAFANSPAPSSLPIPKFFLQQEAAKATSSDESPVAKRRSPAVGTVTKSLNSLDLLFDADRKEKATKRQATPEAQAGTHSSTDAASKNGMSTVQHFDDAQWRDYKSKQLKDLITAKPSTPPQQNVRSFQQHMSAPSQISTAPSQPEHQTRSDAFYYGNRHLSPMFEAARQGGQFGAPLDSTESSQRAYYHPPTTVEEQTRWDNNSQYPPNPTKTAAYQTNNNPAQPHTVPTSEYLPQSTASPSKTQKEDALRKMIGMK